MGRITLDDLEQVFRKGGLANLRVETPKPQIISDKTEKVDAQSGPLESGRPPTVSVGRAN